MESITGLHKHLKLRDLDCRSIDSNYFYKFPTARGDVCHYHSSPCFCLYTVNIQYFAPKIKIVTVTCHRCVNPVERDRSATCPPHRSIGSDNSAEPTRFEIQWEPILNRMGWNDKKIISRNCPFQRFTVKRPYFGTLFSEYRVFL